MSKVVIVGGVAAGASTAARLRRLDENIEIIMLERGEDISFANCGLPYYINGVIAEREGLLVQTPVAMSKRFNIDVRNFSEAREILRDTKEVRITNLIKGETYLEGYDYLVLCPGAAPFVPPVRGIDKQNVFKIRNIPDTDKIKDYIENRRISKAVVLGGGFIGMEMLEVLYELGIKTSLIEAAPQVMGGLDMEMSSIVHNYMRSLDIELILGDTALEMSGGDFVSQIRLSSGKLIDADLVILGTGVKPETWLAAEAGLEIGKTGGIVVNEYLQTSDPSIYAAGDAIQVKDFLTSEDIHVPLAGPANRQGWLIANNITGRKMRYTGSQGTGILKFMDMSVAYTGKNEKQLQQLGIDYLACHAHPNSHASYYPGSTQMTVKLLFAPGDGKVLGGQIVGYDGVDKRIDVLATAMRAGFTVYDLQELELAYAPPYSSAKDPVNMVAYIAGNMLNGDVEVIFWREVADKLAQGAFLLDVRPQEAIDETGMVPGAYHIFLHEIRERLEEIPYDKEILVYCRSGLTSYIANRILRQKGYKVKNISGGYMSYLQSGKN